MSGQAERAHAIVTALGAAADPPAWRLERTAVVRRLHELVDDPDLVRQGNLNLCGPAALLVVWLRHDPAGAVSFAARLFEEGRAPVGTWVVQASTGLLGQRYGTTPRASTCPQADWMLMAALRDATNRVLRYSRPGGLGEAAAAITLPGAVRAWLTATGQFALVVDQTTLVRPKPLAQALELAPGPDREVLLLVAQEIFRRPVSRLGRARDRVVGLVPNHWVILRSPIELLTDDRLGFRFWSWGAEHRIVLDRTRFVRGYHGSLTADALFPAEAAA